jgi:GntR family transcriptional regulator of vanillate catabolism
MTNDKGSQTLRMKALAEARTLILSGVFAPGERISEPLLADRLDVSRTPLREALASLAQEGLVEQQASGRWQVCSYSIQDIMDAIEVRGTLEGLAARFAAERGIASDRLAACRGILSDLDDIMGVHGATDFGAYVSLNAAFHAWIAESAGSQILLREVDRVSRMPLASPSSFLDGQEDFDGFGESLVIAQHQHWAIFEAIESREASRAEALALEHARLARQNLKLLMAGDEPSRANVPGLSLVTK